MGPSPKLPPILCYVTDRRAPAHRGEKPGDQYTNLSGRITLAARAGVDWIQIREKDIQANELLALARSAVAEHASNEVAPNNVRGSASIFINDRLDVALAAGAAGVHLGEQSLPVAVVHAARVGGALPKDFQIGASCHSLEAARSAERDGANYVFFGPVFATPSKAAFGAPQGIGRLAEVSETLKIPVLAIGGVNEENAAECFAAGAAGVAAIRMFQESADLPELVARLRSKN
ncbi:MAG TPA: thiamine phosphate synthase [Candidatus Acidoferrales bacterium]|nr:thiamine phosphate synthase [Candidatus Acidoferrales bacterium]